MWTQCPNCQKKKNYIPILSWFITATREQCHECTRMKRLERKANDQTMDREVVTMAGCHIYKPHYQDSHM